MGKAPWPEVFAVAIVAGATAVAIRGWPHWGAVESQTLAAWVQAVGSILAIIGTVWAVRGSARAASRQQDERQRRAVLAVASAVQDRVNQIAEAVKKPDLDWRLALAECYVRSIMDGLAAALSEIPAHQLPNQKAVTAFLMLQQHLAFFTINIEKLDSGPWNDPSMVKLLDRYMGAAKEEAARDFGDKMEKLLKENVQRQARLVGDYVRVIHAELNQPE